MNEIKLTGGYYTSINSKGNKELNLARRIRALNEFYFADVSSLFERWVYKGLFNLNEQKYAIERCLCGKCIYNFFVIVNQNVKVIVGSKCIQKFFQHTSAAHLLELRKTYDCISCEKKHKKEPELKNEIDTIRKLDCNNWYRKKYEIQKNSFSLRIAQKKQRNLELKQEAESKRLESIFGKPELFKRYDCDYEYLYDENENPLNMICDRCDTIISYSTWKTMCYSCYLQK